MKVTKTVKKTSTRDRYNNPCIVDIYLCDEVCRFTGGKEVNIEILETFKKNREDIISASGSQMQKEQAQIDLNEIKKMLNQTGDKQIGAKQWTHL